MAHGLQGFIVMGKAWQTVCVCAHGQHMFRWLPNRKQRELEGTRAGLWPQRSTSVACTTEKSHIPPPLTLFRHKLVEDISGTNRVSEPCPPLSSAFRCAALDPSQSFASLESLSGHGVFCPIGQYVWLHALTSSQTSIIPGMGKQVCWEFWGQCVHSFLSVLVSCNLRESGNGILCVRVSNAVT